MVLYAYLVLIVFLLCRETSKLILVEEPLILRWFCHSWLSEQAWGNTLNI
jgi:hypothetical protein